MSFNPRVPLFGAALAFAACAPGHYVTERVFDYSLPYPRHVEIPHLAASAGPGAVRVNRFFEDRLADEYGCWNPGSRASKMSYDFRATVVSRRGWLLMVRTEFDWYCGGPHPSSGNSSLFFDLRTGDLVMLQDLLERGKKAEFVDRYLERASPPSAECAPLRARSALLETAFEFVPRASGASVFPVFPYALQACAHSAVFTWEELAGLMDLAPFGETH